MVSRISKVTIKTISLIIAILLLANFGSAFAVSDTDSTDFNVSVKEVLSVSISTPTNWASGDIDTFLRNKVSISVVSNNTAGFTASMTTKTANTSLVNTAKNTATLPTLSAASARSSFPANYWGYSLDDTEAGSSASTYRALVGAGSTPITILSSNSASSGSRDFYFGAKANTTLAAGTYSGTVVISVVSGVIDNTNPITPVDPVKPNPTPNTPTYNPTRNVTSYTYNNTSPTTSTIATDVNSGDVRDVYSGYTPPQGVTYTTTAKIQNLATLATGLTLAAAIAATSSIFFLFAARREEEDEEDDENML